MDLESGDKATNLSTAVIDFYDSVVILENNFVNTFDRPLSIPEDILVIVGS